LFLGLVVFSVLACITVLPLYAAEPAVFLEHSSIVGVGDKIHITRVPTRDSEGKIKYFDIKIDLNVTDQGTIDAIAITYNKRSPQLFTNDFGN
jgi:hypothetical protein